MSYVCTFKHLCFSTAQMRTSFHIWLVIWNRGCIHFCCLFWLFYTSVHVHQIKTLRGSLVAGLRSFKVNSIYLRLKNVIKSKSSYLYSPHCHHYVGNNTIILTFKYFALDDHSLFSTDHPQSYPLLKSNRQKYRDYLIY